MTRVLAGLLIGFLQGASALPSPEQATLLVDVQVVPMDREEILRDRAVLIRGERIVAVGPRDELEVPPTARVVEGHGGYLLPGLIDLHVHLTAPTDLPLYLANGVTTVRNAGGHDGHLAWRDAVREGRLLGPTIYSCGPQVFDLTTPAEAEALVAAHLERGWDCIKVYDRVEAEAWIALVAAVRERGILVAGHIPRNLTWQDMLAAGPDSVDHMEEFLYSPLSGEDLPGIAATMRKNGTAIISTLTTYDLIGRQVLDLENLLERREMAFTSPIERRVQTRSYNGYLKRFDLARVPRLRELLTTQKRILRRLHDDGVRILAGTDAGPGMAIPGYSMHDELLQLVDAGLSPFQALQAATIHAAEYLRAGDDVGRIAAGRVADLFLVLGNPLEDISNTSLILGVMSRGRWQEKRELDATVQALRALFEPEEAMIEVYETRGFEALMAHLEAQLATGGPLPVRERTLNELGYQLRYVEERPAEAVALFELVTRAWPESWNAWDSLAETLEATGADDRAAQARERSRRLRGSP